MASENRTIKTYMSFGLPVDPSNVKTLVDLDLSYALAATLVEWSDERRLTNGLADQVESQNANDVAFKLRSEAKWSDGNPVTATQVAQSFSRAKKLHGEDLKSLFEMIEDIEAKDNSTVIFHLNRPAASSQILHKLTEPMYGILFVKTDGTVDLSKTTGAFSLKSENSKELVLVANPTWIRRTSSMAEEIIVRQPPKVSGEEQDVFSSDPWPNLIATNSVVSKEVSDLYQKNHLSIWNRNLDRVFYIAPGPRLANTDGRTLVLALNQKIDRPATMSGLTGYTLSEQFFPPGFVIFDKDFHFKASATHIPERFRKAHIEILSPEGRLSGKLRSNLSTAIEKVTGQAPVFKIVALSEFEKERAKGQYDLLASTLAVNDPNVEGAVSFFFGVNPPFFPNSGEGSGDFRGRALAARTLPEGKRNIEYKKIFDQVINDGCLLPLFHFSSVALAREGLDLSAVPTSDETVSFSKIRFK